MLHQEVFKLVLRHFFLARLRKSIFYFMVQPEDVGAAIRRQIPDAHVTVEDLSGGGDHLQVNVISKAFIGLSLIRQHQMVYGALKNELASEAIHALALNTSTPN